jgi:HlyD family secretion protein
MNRKRVVPVVLLALAIVAAYVMISRRRSAPAEFVASGTVEATDAALGFQTPGRVERVGPHEGDRVKAGDDIASLDRTELEARRAEAQAQLASARASLADLEAGTRPEDLAQAGEALHAATDRQADAQRDFDRTQKLFQGGAVAQEALDKAKLALSVATTQRNQADQQLKLLELGPRTERVAAQRAMVAVADAAVRQTDAAIANAVIKAPFDGVVSVRDREPGETVGAGAPVLTLVNLNDRWVRIYIREDQIGAVHIGQAATMTSDTYPNKTYAGTVSFIASQAEFTPRNVQTTEERVKLVYAVKVRIVGDSANDLKPGIPADVKLK